ncbi:MAG TPA: 16S rRNA (cytidine(1402)-2'-O)-methyltransferase [Thermoflexia bacterium]|nr:16S rRNA (cytidine(1402)-2'-O)-methyltransferase [Thermoflexia bacterium]
MGTLYLVGTPIGNLEDITLRALRVLREVPLIAAEDTRRARILLDRYEITTPVVSYFEGNKAAREHQLLEALERGDVALISEAGMPGLSDPGYELVRAAVERGHRVVPIPGPSAPIAALVASGLPTDQFVYLGFLPRRRSQRRALLAEVAHEPRTLVAFETPHRLQEALTDLEEVLGDRPVAICRELTKRFEEIWRGTLSQARSRFQGEEPRGEFTLVIGGALRGEERWDAETVRRALEQRLRAGIPRSEAVREVAALSGWNRREVYQLSLEEPRTPNLEP